MRFLAHIAHFHWDKLLGGKWRYFLVRDFGPSNGTSLPFVSKKIFTIVADDAFNLRKVFELCSSRHELWMEIDAFHGNMAKLKRRRNKLSRDSLPVTFSKQNNFLVSKSQFLLFLNLSNFRH